LKNSPCKYQVGFNRRIDHNFRAVKRAVDEGKIGDVHIVKITSRDPEPPPPAYIKVSGGIFLDMTIHDFDMIRYLTGSEAKEIYASGEVLIDQAIKDAGDIDTAVVTVKMENGAICVIDNSRKSVYGYDQRAEVFGSKGCVAVSNDKASSAVISTADAVYSEKPLWFFLERYIQSYRDEIKSFIQAIEQDKPTEVNVYDGLQPVRMGLAAKLSLLEGRPVKLTEIKA
ncbi:MAG: Gfo/Idh/MocA family oxidoreductase, partial [Bacillota bacterium]|nr:Gfo/Idh/MocA family oxidoreductase [Bacillota bacterium]